MKVRYSPRASDDLDSIYQFLNQSSPAGAARVMAAIYAAVEFIRRNPHASEMTSFHGVRGKIVHRYRFKVFYRLAEHNDVVEIVHVRHASRRPWSEEEQ
jgi:toxin ParE1/3/4